MGSFMLFQKPNQKYCFGKFNENKLNYLCEYARQTKIIYGNAGLQARRQIYRTT